MVVRWWRIVAVEVLSLYTSDAADEIHSVDLGGRRSDTCGSINSSYDDYDGDDDDDDDIIIDTILKH